MSQVQMSPGQGLDESEDQVRPSSFGADANGAPDFEGLLGNALLEDLGVAPEKPLVDSDPDDLDDPEAHVSPDAEFGANDDDDAVEVDADSATSPAPLDPRSPQAMMPRWVSQVTQNPKSINQIPAKHHPAVMQAIFEQERAVQVQAVQVAHDYGLEQGAQSTIEQLRTYQAVSEIEELKRSDPVGYVQWRDRYRDRALAYDAVTAPQPAPAAPDPRMLAVHAYQAAATPLRRQLEQHPAAKARMEAKLAADPSLYGPTAAGMEQFAADVAEEVAAERMVRRTKDEEPARQAVEQRRSATAERRGTPRPDVSSGRRAADQLTDDVDELLGMGLAEVFRGPTPKAAR